MRRTMVSHKCIVRCTRFVVFLVILLIFALIVQFAVDGEDDDSWVEVDGRLVKIDPGSRQERNELELKVSRESAEAQDIQYPVIVWWTGFTGEPGRLRTCGSDTCFFTANTNFQNHSNTKVFMFYGTDYEAGKLPMPRLPQHEWAVFHEESPKNNYLFSHKETLELFNHTATFRQNSHYPLTSQYLADLIDLETLEYMLETSEKTALMRDQGLAMVAYVQSDCGTPSDRDHFVQMLQRRVAVDSYGKCLHNKDLPDHLVDPIEGMDHKDFFHHMARYKFILAMENAVCDDYITEKFWRPFTVGSVPIVFGASTARSYLPAEHSAIFIEDFGTIDELVDFLLQLNNSDEDYDEYLRYKQTGVTNMRLKRELAGREWGVNDGNKPNFIEGFECLVCQRLHDNLHRTARGQSPIRYQAEVNHYGCPRPKKFSDWPKGSLSRVDDRYWSEEYESSKYQAKAIRELIAEGKAFSERSAMNLAYIKKTAHHEA